MSERRYADPAALRRAIADRLRQLAHEQPGTQLTDLQRQFAYDRLLARVFGAEPEAWVLKGAAALLARLGGSARHTLDVDLYRPAARLDEAEAALRATASVVARSRRECRASVQSASYRATHGPNAAVSPS